LNKTIQEASVELYKKAGAAQRPEQNEKADEKVVDAEYEMKDEKKK
ncbi:TPA: hypothetical protein HA238_01715, partial [Candidatus Micrarchaeota archaeon]|nr:hypothetical protein [Candidatus Micrarchaeota archaeon]